MLEHFFGSKTRVKLLQVFFSNEERSFFVRELARITDTQLNAVRRELANLQELGLITQVVQGPENLDEPGTERSKYFQLCTDSLLFSEVKALLIKGALIEEKELIEQIKAKAGVIKLFLLTGIFTQENGADTDLVIVGKLKMNTITKLIKEYEVRSGKEIRFTLMDEKEFHERREIGDRFLFSIFEAKHILLVNEYNIS